MESSSELGVIGSISFSKNECVMFELNVLNHMQNTRETSFKMIKVLLKTINKWWCSQELEMKGKWKREELQEGRSRSERESFNE